MQKEKHVDVAVIIYMVMLMVIVVFNMLKGVRVLDIIYLITLVCCVCKLLIIRRR